MAAGMAYAFEAGENFQQLRFMAGAMAEICRHRRTKCMNVVPQQRFQRIQTLPPMGLRRRQVLSAGGFNPDKCTLQLGKVSNQRGGWGKWRGHPVHLSE
jgi:hypothetical protein